MSISRKLCWTGFAVAVLIGPGCVTAASHMAVEDELAKTQDELDYTREELAKAEDLLLTAELGRDELERLRGQLEQEQADRLAMEDQLKQFQQRDAVLTSGGWETFVDAENGLVGYRTEGDVLFASGSDQLTKAGKSALDLVVQRLKQNESPVRVDGHTDSDPIKKTKDKYPYGNIQLGAARAISVRDYLVKQGLSPERFSIASFGEFKPRVSGKDADSKAKNRRVEIMQPMGRPVAQG